MNSTVIKKNLIRFGNKLYQKGFVANHDGNLSAKVGQQLWMTPTAQSKGDVTESMLVSTDLKGKQLSGSHKHFSELNLHLACYGARSDITSVVHAHPPVATAFASAGKSLSPIFIAEAIVTLGDQIPLVPFIPPGCPNTSKVLSSYFQKADVVLLENHGVLAVGRTLEEAYYRLELVEHLAHIEEKAQSLGGIKPLPPSLVQKLLTKRAEMKLGWSGIFREEKPLLPPLLKEDSLRSLIKEEISRILN